MLSVFMHFNLFFLAMGSGKAAQRERGRGRLGDASRQTKRDETFVSPVVKWLMFSFNMFFWVSATNSTPIQLLKI